MALINILLATQQHVEYKLLELQGAGFDGNLAPGADVPKQTTRQVFRQMLLTARSRSW